jgi:hypothetical protein
MISEVSNDLLLDQTEVMLNSDVLDWVIEGKLILQVGIFDFNFYRFHLVDLGLCVVTPSKVHDFGWQFGADGVHREIVHVKIVADLKHQELCVLKDVAQFIWVSDTGPIFIGVKIIEMCLIT